MGVDKTHNQSLKDLDKDVLFHAVSSIADINNNGPLIIKSAEGARLTDIDGKEFLDGGGGLWCKNIGYGREEIANTARDAILNLSYFHNFSGASNEPVIRLADRLLRLFHQTTPASNLSRVFYGLGGSDANDTNFKLVRYYNNLRGKPNKKKIIAREGAYHGLTYASASLTGISAYHKAWDLPIEGVLHTSCPHYYRFHAEGESEAQFTDRMVADLEAMIEREGAETIAAFFAEPVMGTGGVLLPPTGYFERVQKILKDNDILFVADEVITGFGRLGSWFGCGHYNLKPDIVTLAKGLSSAYFPISASVIGDEIWNVLEKASPEHGPVMHGYTYSGHPVGGAIALTNLDILERENLVDNAADVGTYLLEKLRSVGADNPFVGDVRGVGLMIGIEYVADKQTRRLFDPACGAHKVVAGKCFAEGLITRALPFIEVTSFSPPLVISRADADEIVDLYTKGLEAATPELEKLSKG